MKGCWALWGLFVLTTGPGGVGEPGSVYLLGPAPLGLGGLSGQDYLRDLGVVSAGKGKGQLVPLGDFRLRKGERLGLTLAWHPPACPPGPSGNQRTGPL